MYGSQYEQRNLMSNANSECTGQLAHAQSDRILASSSIYSTQITNCKRTVNAMIRLCGCAGWSGRSLFADLRYFYPSSGSYVSRNMRKPNFWYVRPTKTQIRLRILAVWSESSLSASRNFASLAIQNAPSEDSDQTARMRRLIWIFAGRTCPKVRFLMLQLI